MKNEFNTINIPFSKAELNVAINALYLVLRRDDLSKNARELYGGLQYKLNMWRDSFDQIYDFKVVVDMEKSITDAEIEEIARKIANKIMNGANAL